MIAVPMVCPVCQQPTNIQYESLVSCTSCKIFNQKLNFPQRITYWARQRYWRWRLPILLLFVVMLVDNIKNPMESAHRLFNPLYYIDFGMHELGHELFSWAGRFWQILGGSLTQLLFPLFWMLGSLQKRWYFSASLCFAWMGLNLFAISIYVADANSRMLPLAIGLGFFGVDQSSEETTNQAYDQGHDWYQLLSRTDLLQYDTVIAHGMRVTAIVFFVTSFLLAGYLLVQMFYGQMERRRNQALQATIPEVTSAINSETQLSHD